MKSYSLYTIDKSLSGIPGEAIGQPGATLVRDDRFNTRKDFVWNQASVGRCAGVDGDE